MGSFSFCETCQLGREHICDWIRAFFGPWGLLEDLRLPCTLLACACDQRLVGLPFSRFNRMRGECAGLVGWLRKERAVSKQTCRAERSGFCTAGQGATTRERLNEVPIVALHCGEPWNAFVPRPFTALAAAVPCGDNTVQSEPVSTEWPRASMQQPSHALLLLLSLDLLVFLKRE